MNYRVLAIMNQGKVVQKITPMEATKSIAGKIWTKTISRHVLEQAEATYPVLTSSYNQDRTITIRVFSDVPPSAEFILATPDLEDVYFITLQNEN